jgi:hypothetical protein
MPVTAELLARVTDALRAEPDESGGPAVVIASAGGPPPMALLATSSVWLDGSTLRAALLGTASVVQRLGGSCTFMLTHADAVLRVSVEPATARPAGDLIVIEGPVADVRPSVELPWRLELRFIRQGGDDLARVHLRYWALLRVWLRAGARGEPPPPCSGGA